MGGGSWQDSTWRKYKTSSGISNNASVHQIFNQSTVKNDFRPYNVVRESCDSDEHPNSSPIILGLDVTGSMGHLLHTMANKLGVTMGEIYKRNVLPDPQILCAAIDDYVSSDAECLQVTQFESDIRIAEQLKQLKFIQYGAGNGWESYPLVWYFAARHTKCDAIKKGKKGVIITMGDDGFQPRISREEIREVFGDNIESDLTTEELLSEVNRNWEVFHLNIAEGASYSKRVEDSAKELLGNHSITVEDTDKIPEIIVSILQTLRGDSVTEIANSWDGSTAVIVKDALKNLDIVPREENSGVVVF